ncbi:type II toxin-antitoxin system PemK/MazF family toxin [Acetobacter malorum]|uniref:type II toxin-antitoxin system PemK/MazF family toxin n=1 Tax=Acetobacter malorum TaxID=178901 RepID=UPI0009EF2164|nr:type II toxin-antitoxin system PemK/MazF family toxin [Acetobacter malorum]
MKRGDIYRVNLNPTQGHEQNGTRRVVVVSPDRFNIMTKTPVVLPITTGEGGTVYAQNLGFAVPAGGETTTGIIRCDQPRALAIEAREGELVDRLPDDILDDVLARVTTLFQ